MEDEVTRPGREDASEVKPSQEGHSREGALQEETIEDGEPQRTDYNEIHEDLTHLVLCLATERNHKFRVYMKGEKLAIIHIKFPIH